MRALSDWRVRAGVVLGLSVAMVLGGLGTIRGPEAALRDHGAVLSDCDGAIRELVIHYTSDAAGVVETAYREFLGQLPEGIVVHVVCPDQRAFDDLRARVGPVACRLTPVLTGHAITCWSRDRWLVLAPKRAGRPSRLLLPRDEAGAAAWPERRGDQRTGEDLAAALAGGLISYRSALAFDGGDFVADADTVFVTPEVLRRNMGAVRSSLQLGWLLSVLLQRKVVLLSQAPDHHAGMFMMLAGDKTAVVGDPSLAEGLLRRDRQESYRCPIASPDFSEELRRRFDAVAAQCAACGYRVVRIPVVPATDGRTYLTYLNVILDQRGGKRTVYMPVYRDAEALNDAAAAIWESLGYQVRRVDCTDTYRHFGSLRCLVNVLRRS